MSEIKQYPQGYNNPVNDLHKINNRLVSDMVSGSVTNPRDIIFRMSLDDNQEIDYNSVINTAIRLKYIKQSEVKKIMADRKIEEAIGCIPENCMKLVKAYFEKNKIEVDITGNITFHMIPNKLSNEIGMNLEKCEGLYEQGIETNCRFDIEEYGDKINVLNAMSHACNAELSQDKLARKIRILRDEFGLTFGNKSIEDCISELTDEISTNIRVNTYKNIAHYKHMNYDEQEQDWKNIVTGLFNDSEMSYDCTISILKKFIWQVKRKMTGNPVTNHNMVVIVGKQGSGKTTFVEKLLSPVKDVSIGTNMEEIGDQRNVDLFSYYVMFLDEMSRADRADIETIKNIITTKQISRRILGTSKIFTKNQNSTFIGCSNKNLDQVISDETGIRRFVPLQFKNNPDWTVLENVNFKKLWSSVSEFGDDPSEKYFEEVKTIQSQYRTKTACEDWINSLKHKDTTEKFVDGRKWYVKFQTYEELYYPHRNTSFSTWDREMNRLCNQTPELGFDCVISGNTRFYKFSWEDSQGMNTPWTGEVEQILEDVKPNDFVDENGNIKEDAKETVNIAINEEEEFKNELKRVESISVENRTFYDKFIMAENSRRLKGHRPRSFEEIRIACEETKERIKRKKDEIVVDKEITEVKNVVPVEVGGNVIVTPKTQMKSEIQQFVAKIKQQHDF